MNHLQRIARNSVFQGLAYAVQSVSAFVVPVYLARQVGAELVGQYATMVTFASLFACLSIFGLPSLLVREIARRRDNPAQITQLVDSTIGLTLTLSAIALLLMVAVGWLLGYSVVLTRALALTGLALAVEALASALEASFRGIEEMEKSAAILVAMDGTFLAVTLIIVPFTLTIDWLMVAYLTSRVASLAVGLWLYQARIGRLRPAFDKGVWAFLLKTCFPFAINNGMSSVYVRIDVVFLSFLAGSTVVGLYDAANNLTMRVNILARVISFALYPFLSAQFVSDRNSVHRYTAQAIRYLFIPGFLITTILWVFGTDIVVLLYGTKFLEAVTATKWLALIIPIRFVDTSLAIALSASNREGKRAVAVGTAAVTNVLLDFLLIPPYHMMGAVYATLLTEVVLLGMYLWYLRAEARELLGWQAVAGPGLGALTILAASLLFRTINPWLVACLSVLLYVLVVVWLDRSSLEFFRLIVAKRQS